MTARQPGHRTLAVPARFAARWRELAACRGTDLGVFFPERRALRSGWVRASRQDRDRAVLAAKTDGYTAAAIGRSFGLSRTSVTRVLSRDADRRPS